MKLTAEMIQHQAAVMRERVRNLDDEGRRIAVLSGCVPDLRCFDDLGPARSTR